MRTVAALVCVAASLSAQTAPPDPLLTAMKDEVARSGTLVISSLDKPYFIEYTVEDVHSYAVSATLGGILSRNSGHVRIPRTRVRVGDYAFDNSNYVFSDSGATNTELSLDNDYTVLRRSFWLITDRAFKNGVEAITRKRAAMRNMTQQEALADFWKAKPVEKVLPASKAAISLDTWSNRVKNLSSIFTSYPEVLSSTVNFDASDATFYLANSEGSTLRLPDFISTFQVRASGQAKDGMVVRDAAIVPVLDEKTLPSEPELKKLVDQVARNVKNMAAAPVGETYSGPVLFEGIAGAQVIAEVLGPHLALSRKPIGEPGRPAPYLPSELEFRFGARVLPEFLTVVDDPTQKAWNGAPLLGSYEYDYEGVQPAPLTVVDKGTLKAFLLSRQPVRNFEASNGRARVPGPYGASSAAMSNLFIKSSESVKAEELRARFLKMIGERGKPYGIVVRRMDFPTTAPNDELRRRFMSAAQAGNTRAVSTPLHVYRVYPDGKEELVRGLHFRGLNVRALRDIVAVSAENYAFHFMNTLAPMSMPGGGYVAPTSVIAPSILMDDLELERPQEDLPKLPVVPPPPLSAAAAAAAR